MRTRRDRPGPSFRRRLLVALVFLASALAMGACNGPGALSPKDIKNHGVMLLRTTPDKAYKASLEALKALGYEIAAETPATGTIVTKRKGMPDMSAASPSGATFSRQYTIEIRDAGGGARVTATPAIFENERDVSSKKVWDLDGPFGENELWKQLFAKIEQLL